MDSIDTCIKNILIIDDKIDAYNELNQILLDYNIKTKIITNEISAIKEIEKSTYDCYFISESFGFDKIIFLIDTIKLNSQSNIVFLIFDNPSVNDLIPYFKYDVDQVLLKPFQWATFLDAISFYNF